MTMTAEEIEKRITDAAGFINRAADVTQDVEAAGDLTPEEAGAIYTGLSAAGMLIDELRETQRRLHGAICPTHGLAVLMVHVNDSEPCSDFLTPEKQQSKVSLPLLSK